MTELPIYNPLFSSLVRRLPSPLLDLIVARPLLKTALEITILLNVFMSLKWLIMGLASLPLDSYAAPSLLIVLIKRAGFFPLIAIGCTLIIGLRYGSIWAKWQTLQQGNTIRYFVVFLGFLIAWPLCTYGYNFYFDQGYYIERVTIALLLVLLWWRPIFIFPFLLIVFTTLLQLKQPNLGGTILAHKLQVLHVLSLFAAAFLIHVLSGYRKMNTFIFVCCCMVASAYWSPAYAKMQISWLSYGQLYHGTLAAYAHGWLGFLQPEQIVTFAQSIAWLDWPMRIAVIVIEGGCLLFMLNRKVSMALLVAVIIFHIGVFILIGFLFWTWILLDLALLLLLLKDYNSQSWSIYNKHYLLLSIVLIGLGAYWAKPPALAWFDTRLAYTFKIDAVTEQGERYTLPPEFFAPYEDIFTMAAFSYLVKDHNVLVAAYGVTKDHDIAAALKQPLSAEKVFELEKTKSRNNYNAKRAEIFYSFIARFVANHNARDKSALDLFWLSPPRQFWSFNEQNVNIGQDRIIQLIVSEFTSLYDGISLNVIRQNEIIKLDIDDYERK